MFLILYFLLETELLDEKRIEDFDLDRVSCFLFCDRLDLVVTDFAIS